MVLRLHLINLLLQVLHVFNFVTVLFLLILLWFHVQGRARVYADNMVH